jgi:hypothetical protein
MHIYGCIYIYIYINLDKRLPEILKKMAQFSTILDQHIDDDKPLTDFPSWMVMLEYIHILLVNITYLNDH